MKKEYQSPSINVISMKVENQLLGVSAETKDPTEGGDPTKSGGGSIAGGTGEDPEPNTPNPFDQFNAKAGLFDEDIKMW